MTTVAPEEASTGAGQRIVYLMRGLPSSGKSHTARRLAGVHGVVCETDEYFHTQVGDDPTRYDYDRGLREAARRWNLERFRRAVDAGHTPIVVDRGNGLSPSTLPYVRYAREHGYALELREPESEWWQEIRVLLKYRHLTGPALLQWAETLARISAASHRVSAAAVYRRMGRWRHEITIEDILAYDDAYPGDPAAAPPDEADGESAPTSGSVRALRPDDPHTESPPGPELGRQWLVRVPGAARRGGASGTREGATPGSHQGATPGAHRGATSDAHQGVTSDARGGAPPRAGSLIEWGA